MKYAMRLNFVPHSPISMVAIRIAIQLVRARRRKIKFEIERLEREREVLERYDAALTNEYGPGTSG